MSSLANLPASLVLHRHASWLSTASSHWLSALPWSGPLSKPCGEAASSSPCLRPTVQPSALQSQPGGNKNQGSPLLNDSTAGAAPKPGSDNGGLCVPRLACTQPGSNKTEGSPLSNEFRARAAPKRGSHNGPRPLSHWASARLQPALQMQPGINKNRGSPLLNDFRARAAPKPGSHSGHWPLSLLASARFRDAACNQQD